MKKRRRLRVSPLGIKSKRLRPALCDPILLKATHCVNNSGYHEYCIHHLIICREEPRGIMAVIHSLIVPTRFNRETRLDAGLDDSVGKTHLNPSHLIVKSYMAKMREALFAI